MITDVARVGCAVNVADRSPRGAEAVAEDKASISPLRGRPRLLGTVSEAEITSSMAVAFLGRPRLRGATSASVADDASDASAASVSAFLGLPRFFGIFSTALSSFSSSLDTVAEKHLD